MGELLEVVDEKDNAVGIQDREIVHSSRLWHRLAHVLLYNQNGELLLQMRAPNKKVYPNKWDCSCSEHLKPNEAYDVAAKRGLEEELGIREIGLKEVLYCRGDYGDEGNVISKVFVCKTDKTPTSIDTEEVYMYKFFTESGIKRMLADNEDAFATWAAEQLKWKLGLPNKLELL